MSQIKKEKVVKSSKKKSTVNTMNVPSKNYVYALLILIGGILLTLYIFEWINVKKEEKLMNSYLITSNTINSKIEDFNSLTQVLSETSSSYFIYLSYTGDEDVYNFEKKLKKIIDDYGLSDNFYYMDLTKMMNDNENYLEEIKENLNISTLEKLPAIICVKDGHAENINVLDGVKGEMLSVNDLEKFLDVYEYEKVN